MEKEKRRKIVRIKIKEGIKVCVWGGGGRIKRARIKKRIKGNQNRIKENGKEKEREIE